MDLEPQNEPKLAVPVPDAPDQAAQGAGAAPGSAAAGAPQAALSGPAETAAAPETAPASVPQPEAPKEDPKGKKQEAVPSVPPIPSSALVILPPSMRRFESEKEREPKRPAGRGGLFRYASRAAIFLLLAGGAFAAGGRYLGSVPLLHGAADPSAPAWQAAKNNNDPSAGSAQATTAALSDQVHGLEARFDAMQSAVETHAPDEIRSLQENIDALKASLEAEKAQTDASIAQLSAKLDQLEKLNPRLAALEKNERGEAKSEKAIDPKAIQATLERAARSERADAMTTASVPANVESKAQPAAVEPQRKPPLLTNWVVRDVYDGIALVEGPEGAIEVMPGDVLPGAGVVKSIERRGGGWVVLTSRGLVQYAGE
ncbi:MAG TPA: hypothetical protein VKV77_14755 [Methylovirgula sp.]|nr:hypothetical protein [Methylovirgula sp.]